MNDRIFLSGNPSGEWGCQDVGTCFFVKGFLDGFPENGHSGAIFETGCLRKTFAATSECLMNGQHCSRICNAKPSDLR